MFSYAATIALNHGEIESHPDRVSNIKSFRNKFKRKGINYPLKDWKMIGKHLKKNSNDCSEYFAYRGKRMSSLYLKN